MTITKSLTILFFCAITFLPYSYAKITLHAKPIGETDYHIYVMEDNGSNFRRLTDPSFYDRVPTWFPDGKKIVFQRDLSHGNGTIFNSEFLIYDIKNQIEYKFMENHPTDEYPRISPDGKHVGFTSRRSGSWNIHIIDLENGAVKQLTDNKGNAQITYMSWAPEGKRFAYLKMGGVDGDNIWIYNLNGRGGKRISIPTNGDNNVYRYVPSWSLSGKYIMYPEAELTPDNAKSLAMRVNIQNVFTGDLDIHTFPKEYFVFSGCWMKDDRTLLLSIKNPNLGPPSSFMIYRYNLLNKKLKNLTNRGGPHHFPAWIDGHLAVDAMDKLAIRWGDLKIMD